jgi:Fe-S-cluster-containing dehydrogenase component/CRP-like cAMP-binding protein
MATTSAGGAPVTGAAYQQFLAQLPFFKDVSTEDMSTFANTVLLRHYPPGADVVVQRQYGHAMFVIVEGTLAVHAVGNDENDVELGQLSQPGTFFGEAVLLGRGERTATVTARTNCTLLEIEKHRFDLLARRYKTIREHLELVYHQRAIATYMRFHRYLGMLDDASRADLGRGAKLRLFQRGDQVATKGEAADKILVIKDGIVKAMRKHGEATSILAYFNTHDVIGLNDGPVREYNLEALGHCEIIQIERSAFALAMAKRPDVGEHFGKDDMARKAAFGSAGKTVMMAAQAFLQAGVEVESLLVINLDRCVRCGNCVRACHARHKYTRLDRRGPIFTRRKHVDSKAHEHVMLPASCRHCRDPECMIGCPTGAIQRHGDGDVDINDNCIGCQNCARKCPYGNITMRPLSEKERPSPEVTQRAIKCNLCRGHSYSNCVHECPRGAIMRVDPLRYFEELALVMEAEQKDAIAWSRDQAKQMGLLGTKQQIRPRSTWFIPFSLLMGALALAGLIAAFVMAGGQVRGGSAVGLPLGIAAASCIAMAAFLGARKRMRDTSIGALEIWTQFHMVIGVVGFVAALAHAGFHVTGVFTTLLLVVFALEVATGALGQLIYMTVPRALTRLERHGLARLVEDLLEEEQALQAGITELVQTIPGNKWKPIGRQVEISAGALGDRYRSSYDPQQALEAAKGRLGQLNLTIEERGTVDRVLESRCRLLDVKAQLSLHRRLKRWLVAHVATASALVVLLAFHILTAMTVIK